MLELALEGVRAAVLPCSLALLVPGVVLAFTAGRRAPIALAGYLTAVAVTAWALIVRLPAGPGRSAVGLLAAGWVVGFGLVVVARARPLGTRRGAVGTFGLAGALVGWTATLLWLPCVGSAFGVLLDTAHLAPVAALPGALVHLLGVCLPLVALAALPVAVPRTAGLLDRRPTVWAGALAAAALIVTLGLGAYQDLLGLLLRVSTA